MTLTLLGLILKVVGIALALPNAVHHHERWKEKELARLYEYQSIYTRTGRKPCLSKWRKTVYRINKMPLEHLYR